MKNLAISSVLLVIMIFNIFDVYADMQIGVSTTHIIEEIIVVLITGAAAGYLLFERYQQSKSFQQLITQLKQSDMELKNVTEHMKAARHQYSEAISQQFTVWQLTSSEKQVALLLLKGLSFKEIAAVRNTKEKTVRQQASTVYAKSGVEGRHEFSGWFMEDFLTLDNSTST